VVVLDLLQQSRHGLVVAALFAVGGVDVQELELRGEYALGDQVGVEAVVERQFVETHQPGYLVGDVVVDGVHVGLGLLHLLEVGDHLVVLVGEDGGAVFGERLQGEQAVVDLEGTLPRFVGQNNMAVDVDVDFLLHTLHQLRAQSRTRPPSQTPHQVQSHRAVHALQLLPHLLHHEVSDLPVFLDVLLEGGDLDVAELSALRQLVRVQQFVGQVVEVAVGPVVAPAELKRLEVGGIQPLGRLLYDLPNDFGFGVYHDGVEAVGRAQPIAVVEGGELVVEGEADLAAALPHFHKQRPHFNYMAHPLTIWMMQDRISKLAY